MSAILGTVTVLAALPASAQPRTEIPSGPVEADKLRADPTILLDGKSFPFVEETTTAFPEPRRVFHVSPDAHGGGDGSLERPWKDVQQALRRLTPGDRLVFLPGTYDAAFVVDGTCRAGTADAPIQVFGEEAFLHSRPDAFGLTVGQPFWQFHHVQLVLSRPGSNGVLFGPGAHHVVFDRGHVYEGNGLALVLRAGSHDVSVTHSHIHQTGGVRIEAGARDVTLSENKIHHNLSGSLEVGGSGSDHARQPARNILVTGNKFHNDRGTGIRLRDCRNVRVTANKIYNYRPARGLRGEAIVVGRGAGGIVFEGNYVAEASVGVVIGESTRGQPAEGPQQVILLRNYFENLLSGESVGIELSAGARGVRVLNNAFERFATAIRVSADSYGIEDFHVANNLFLNTSVFAFDLSANGMARSFERNVFGGLAGRASARVGRDSRALAEYLDSGAMAGSRFIAGLRLEGRDLARIQGGSLKDAGKAFEGVSYEGTAPDIGVAEK